MSNQRMNFKVKRLAENLIRLNKERFNGIDVDDQTDYDRGYYEGIHDAILDILNGLNLGTDEEYFNDECY